MAMDKMQKLLPSVGTCTGGVHGGADAEDPLESRRQLFLAEALEPVASYTGPTSFTLAAKGRGLFRIMPPVTLTYFALRATGELPTLILEASGYPYKAVRVLETQDEFHGQMKKTLPFGRMPIVQDGSLVIAQSAAVARYLAKKCHFDGGSEASRARCDMLFEQLVEANGDFDVGALLDKKKGPAASETVRTGSDYSGMSWGAVFGASPVDKSLCHLRLFETLVANGWVLSSAQGGGKNQPSYVDLALWQLTSKLGAEWLAARGFQAVAKHITAVESLPGIAAYLKSNRLMPTVTLPDYKYVADKWVDVPK